MTPCIVVLDALVREIAQHRRLMVVRPLDMRSRMSQAPPPLEVSILSPLSTRTTLAGTGTAGLATGSAAAGAEPGTTATRAASSESGLTAPEGSSR